MLTRLSPSNSPVKAVRRGRAALTVAAAVVAFVSAGCSADETNGNSSQTKGATPQEGDDIKDAGGTGLGPSTDPAETVYRYLQLMATGDVEAACALTATGVDQTKVVASSDAQALAECVDGPPGHFNIDGEVTWPAAAQFPIEGYVVESDTGDEPQMEVALTTQEPAAETFRELTFELVHIDDPADPHWYIS